MTRCSLHVGDKNRLGYLEIQASDMVALKQLVVAVEGNACLGPTWPLLCREYLHKIIRCVSGSKCACHGVSLKAMRENAETTAIASYKSLGDVFMKQIHCSLFFINEYYSLRTW